MKLLTFFATIFAFMFFAMVANAEENGNGTFCDALNAEFSPLGGFQCGDDQTAKNLNHRMNQASALAGALDFNASDNNDWTVNLNYANADFNSAAHGVGLNLTYKLPAASQEQPLWGVFKYATIGAGFASLTDGDDTMSALQVTVGW